MTTKELLEARINGAIVQLSDCITGWRQAADDVELNREASRRILKALVRDALELVVDDIDDDDDCSTAVDAIHLIRRLSSQLT